MRGILPQANRGDKGSVDRRFRIADWGLRIGKRGGAINSGWPERIARRIRRTISITPAIRIRVLAPTSEPEGAVLIGFGDDPITRGYFPGREPSPAVTG
jgi:hypothetical protein